MAYEHAVVSPREVPAAGSRPLREVGESYAVVPVLHRPRASPDADLKPAQHELLLERLRPYAESLQVVGMLSQRLAQAVCVVRGAYRSSLERKLRGNEVVQIEH